ncbi:uncharacterized protein LOC131858866 [Cryptomeria japonica]|uniref:uncharacterized protein LOC131858866 n=1 Tax=Cryptomeria japonica TaxID=3369 RepID=UPI0027DA06E3|nr:uncharacterized protein LOC131858866 [Cryptomeria japonica]
MLEAFPLQPIQVEQLFIKWGIDFIGAINPCSSEGHKWVLTTTNYFTRWTEVVALKEASESVVLNFYEDLVTRFGTPDYIISDNALAFVGTKISEWAVHNGRFSYTSSNYYPQGNGLAMSTNKNLIKIIKRKIEDNQRAWHTKLKSTLWANRITPKRSTGNSPNMLVYGKEARFPISLELPAFDLVNQLEMMGEEPMAIMLQQQVELEEIRD